MDWQRLLGAMVPLGVAVARPGQSGAAFVQGFQGTDQMLWQRRQQEQEAQRRQQALEAETRNRASDNERMEQQARLQRLALALQQMNPAIEQEAEFSTDPMAAEQALGNRGRMLEQSMELQPGAMRPFVPTAQAMAPMISQRKIRRAKEKYAEFLKLYGERAGEAEESFSFDSGEFQGMTPAAVRQMAEMTAPPKREPKAATPRQDPAAGSFEDFMSSDPAKQAEILKNRRAYTDAGREQAQGPAAGTLRPDVQRRVDAKSKGFDTQPAVRSIQKMSEAVTFANSLDPNTTNPADDQALIYAFAKAMDPESVVREGEYATVQKYAQSWAETFGFNAARVFSNTAFLSTDARRNMKATIQKKFAAGRSAYENLRKSYASQIDKITGQAGSGEDWLIDYAGGFPESGTAPAAPSGPQIGEERMFNGVRGRWDGKGWVKVQ